MVENLDDARDRNFGVGRVEKHIRLSGAEVVAVDFEQSGRLAVERILRRPDILQIQFGPWCRDSPLNDDLCSLRA